LDSSSTPRRDLTKQIVRAPLRSRSARTSAASPKTLRRDASASSTIGGFHIAICRRGCGEPSASMSVMSSRPVSRSASSTGLATVALAR
jgi:hypothetical protein